MADFTPQVYRHHLTNCVDAVGLASILNIGLSSVFKRNACALSGLTALAVGREYELEQALGINRSFDYTDMSLYVASIAVYLLAHYVNKPQEAGLGNVPISLPFTSNPL